MYLILIINTSKKELIKILSKLIESERKKVIDNTRLFVGIIIAQFSSTLLSVSARCFVLASCLSWTYLVKSYKIQYTLWILSLTSYSSLVLLIGNYKLDSNRLQIKYTIVLCITPNVLVKFVKCWRCHTYIPNHQADVYIET